MSNSTRSRGSKITRWCFTINNPTLADEFDRQEFVYLIVAKEVGESGTPHLQCFGVTKRRLYLTGFKKICPRAHVEKCWGTNAQASNYCKKGQQSHAEWKAQGIQGPNYGLNADYFEHGEMPGEIGEAGGEATKRKYEEAWELAKQGKYEDVDAEIRIKYYPALKKIRQDNYKRPPDLDDVTGVWLYGKPGCGKSYKARHDYPLYFDKPCNKWWDSYQQEEHVIIDDFDMKHECLGHYLKRWGDRYAFPAEVKGTTIQIRPKVICVTSNYRIQEIFRDDMVLREAIQRRYKEIHILDWKIRIPRMDDDGNLLSSDTDEM